jgi:hypothetical protein
VAGGLVLMVRMTMRRARMIVPVMMGIDWVLMKY